MATAGAALTLLTLVLAVVGHFLLKTAVVGRLDVDAPRFFVGSALYFFAFAALYLLASLRGAHDPEPLRTRVTGPEWIARDSGWRSVVRSGFGGISPREWARRVRATVVGAPLRSVLAFISVLLAVTLFIILRYGTPGVPRLRDSLGLWLLSIACYLLVAVPVRTVFDPQRIREFVHSHRQAFIDVGLLFLASLALRLPGLDQWPDVINGDEGIVGNIARSLAKDAGYVFGTQFAYGTLYYLVRSPFVAWLGGGIAPLRIVDAVGGSLAAPALYLAGRQLYGRRIGLVAGVLMAAAHMHIHLSRIALGHAVDGTLAAAVIFAFMRGLQRRSTGWMAIAGVGLGLSQYGYVGGRLLGVVFAAFVMALVVFQPRYVTRTWRLIGVSLGAAFLTALPMIRWAIDMPGDYLARVHGVGFLQSGGLEHHVAASGRPPWLVMLGQVRDGMMSIIAHPASSFYEGKIPMLPFAVGVLFILGLALAAWRIKDRRNLLLLAAVAGGLTVMALGQNVLIAAYRIAGVMPAFILIASVALVLLAEGAVRGLGWSKRIPMFLTAAVVAAIVVYNLDYYYTEHVPECRYTDARSAAASVAAEYIGSLPPETTAVVLASPYLLFDTYPSTSYLSEREVIDLGWSRPEIPSPGEEGDDEYIYSIPLGLVDVAAMVRDAGDIAALAVPERVGELDALQRSLRGGQRTTLRWCGDPVFEVYRKTDGGTQ